MKLVSAAIVTATVALTPATGADSAPRSAPTLCRAPETALFACRVGARIASVCSGAGRTIYRYGRPGAVEIEISSDGRDGLAHMSEVTGQGGGYQRSIRFRRGRYSYIVSAGAAGSLADHPGAPLNMLSVYADGRSVAVHPCRPTTTERLRDAKLPEETDPDFQGWY